MPLRRDGFGFHSSTLRSTRVKLHLVRQAVFFGQRRRSCETSYEIVPGRNREQAVGQVAPQALPDLGKYPKTTGSKL